MAPEIYSKPFRRAFAMFTVALLAICALGGIAMVSEDLEADTCPDCGGSGTVTCPECGGSGILDDGRDGYGCPNCGGDDINEAGSGEVACSTCGGSGSVSHDYVSDGGHWEGCDYYDDETCSICGDTRSSYSHTTHSWGSWTTTKAATCTSSGTQTRTCSDCGDKDTQTISATGHSYVSHSAVSPTCTKSGNDAYYTCSNCSTIFNSSKNVISSIPTKAALGHSWGSWTVTKEATCTDSGTQKHTCSRCSTSETKTISATGHEWYVSSYQWSSDFSKCTVGFNCSNNTSHAGSEVVNSTSTTKGNSKTYSVSGQSSTYGVSYSDTKTVYISTLIFDANGGSGAPSKLTHTHTSTSSHTFTIPTTKPTRSGYTFLGWSTSSSASTASYQPGGSISVSYGSSKTLYAVWEQAEIAITSNPALTSLKVGQAWSYTPAASVDGCAVSVSGADWLSASNGKVSGTPTKAGTYTVTITLEKDGYESATQTFTLKVYSALGFTSGPSATGVLTYVSG